MKQNLLKGNRCIPVLFFMLACNVVFAQNAAHYAFSTNTTSSLSKDLNGTIIDMSVGTTTLIGPGLDATASAVSNIGFTYFLMGKPFTQFAVQDDGIVQLGGGVPATNTYTISGGTPAAPRLSAFCADLRTGLNTGKVHYKLIGIIPNRTLVIEFKEMQLFYTALGAAGTSTYQVRLYENGTVEYVYGTMSASDINSSNRMPAIGFYTNANAGLFASVSYVTQTVTTTGPYNTNTIIATVGPITELNSTIDSTRRAYVFMPDPVPASPTNLTFSNITASSMKLTWTDNDSNETTYQVFRSEDNISYNLVSTLSADTSSITFTDLMPTRRYYFKVIAFAEAGVSDTLSDNQSTLAAAVVRSTSSGGNWTDTLTWVGRIVPLSTDSVVIADSATVTINSNAATCYALTVGEGASGVLRFDSAQAATLTVINNVQVRTNASFNAGTGILTTHHLKIGGPLPTAPSEGSLKVDGLFDMQTSAGASVTFAGIRNARIEGTPTVLDFQTINVNKGASATNRPVLEILAPFTVQGANTTGLITAHTAGLVRVSGTYTLSNPLYASSNYNIPLNGGIHLNNPNFIVPATGIVNCGGLLQVSQGIYYTGQTATQTVAFGSGAAFTVDGGTVIAAAGINATNVIAFNFSGGIIRVATIGNSLSNTASFGITHTLSTVNWTGGSLILEQKSTAAAKIDYNVVPGIPGNTNGILLIGNTATAASSIFNIRGNVPNLAVDSFKTATLTAQLNVAGTIKVDTGSILKLNGVSLLHSGSTITNNGFIDGRTANSNWSFAASASGHIYSGTGIDTIQKLTVADTNAIILNKPVVTYGMAFNNRSPITHSNNIILGNGQTQAVTMQVGITGYASGNVGVFDMAPTFNLGTGSYSLSYLQEGAMRTTGFEIPPNRSIQNLTINNTNNITLAGGDLAIKNVLVLTAGRLITSSANLLKIENTVLSAISGGGPGSYVDGPLLRTLPASLQTTGTYIFPIGKGIEYNRMDLVNPFTNSGGKVDILVESFNNPVSGTADGISMDTLMPEYWTITIPAGKANIDSAYAKFYDSDLTALNKMAYSDSVSGIYKRVSNAAISGTITTNRLVKDTAIEGVFAVGEITNAISGTFLIGANKTAPNYRSLTEATTDIYERRIQGNVVLLLDSDYSSALETFPIVFNPFVSQNPAYTITVKPNTGVSPSIIGNIATPSSIIRFSNGARNYILDGSNNGGNSQHLFIQNTSTTGAVIMFQGTAANQGVQNTILQNTIVKGGVNTSSYGIIVGGTAVNLTSGGIGHKNILIRNNTIYNCNDAVVISGSSASNRVSGVTLLKNTIGTDSVSFYNKRHGVYTIYADSVLISHNTIKNIKSNLGSFVNMGINVNDYTTNSVIDGNIIKGIYTTSVSSTASYGILFSGANGIDHLTVSNNVINDIISNVASPSLTNMNHAFGMRIVAGSNVKLYFNTIHLYGQLVTGSTVSSSAALYITNTDMAGLDIRNNIFSNSLTGNVTGSKHYAFACFSLPASTVFDYNNFVANSSQGYLMYKGEAPNDISTIADLQTATNANLNSVNINPQFINDSNLVLGDGPLTGLGQQISGITTDVDDSIRSIPPMIGAYERKGDIMPPSIQYVPLTKHPLPASSRTLTGFATITDNSSVDATIAKPRLYYRKTSEANVFGTYPGNNNASFNGWKYAEAGNTVSPFSFTIDYSLLTSGRVSTWDTILYFVVAQDTNRNIAANPLTGFAAQRIDSVISAPSVPNRYVIYDTLLAGTYLVGSGNSGSNFPTMNAAISKLHLLGISGPVILKLTDTVYSPATETFPIAINTIEGSSLTNTITLKPDTGKNVVITGISSSGLINFSGTDNFIIDGSNNETAGQNLFIQNAAVAGGAGIMFQGTASNQGSQNCVLKNTKIKGGNISAYGLIIGGTAVATVSTGVGHKNILVQNNTIYNCKDAVAISGTSSTSKLSQIIVKDNTIGTDSSAFFVRGNGIAIFSADSIVITHNSIKNIKYISLSTGIVLNSNVSNTVISGNIIKSIYGQGGARGIFIAPGATLINNLTISNNAISDITASGSSPVFNTANAFGIWINGTQMSDIKVLFNTVHLYGNLNLPATPGISVALGLNPSSSIPGLDIRNNIFSNNTTNTNASSKQYAFANGNTSLTGALFDHNDFTANSPQGILMYNNITVQDINTLPELKTVTGANANSVNIDPQFVNDSNLAIGYGALTGLGTTIAGITGDIDDSLRSSPPTPGAYERKTDLAGPAIFYTPLTKNTGLSARTVTNFATITDYNGVDTLTTKPRIYFRKSTESNVFGTYPVNNNATFNGWKYVEATNTISPFSFTIDYSLLTSGTASIWDTIIYFVAAQDITAKVSASPSAGFVAQGIDSVINAPVKPNQYIVYDTPLAGTYLVGKTQAYPDFTSINAAVNALRARGISAAVELQLTDSMYSIPTETFPVTINAIENSTVANTVTIRPAPGKKVAIIGASTSGLINVNGTDNFIIDGSNNGTTSQDLFIQNMNSLGAGIMFQGTTANQGVQNSLLKNTIIKGGGNSSAYGVIVGGTTVSLTSNGAGHKDLFIQQNTIYNCRDAIVISGTSASVKVTGVSIQNNTIGTDSTLFYNNRFGIYVVNADSISLVKNIIKNVRTTSFPVNAGINLANYTTNTIISANVIKGISSTGSSGSLALGINIEQGTGCDNITINNNAISDIKGSQAFLHLPGSCGIGISGSSNVKLYFNTVNLSGSVSASNANSSAALSIFSPSPTGLDIRNNIFSNSMTGSNSGSKHYAFRSTSPFPAWTFDNNDFFVKGPQGVLMSSVVGTTTTFITTLDELKTATNANAHSVSIDPLFVDDNNLIPNLGTIQGMGITIPGQTIDIRDSLRSDTPTLGAYEKGVDAIAPAIVYTAFDSTTTLLTSRTFSAVINDYSGVDTATFKPRVYYKKQTDADVFGNYPADNNASFNGWKYAEASNGSSPFNFTIDYSLLTSGTATIWETIQYFVVAQDLAAPVNITANPTTGFTATNSNNITKAPSTPNSYLIKDFPLAGTYHVGSAYTYPHFATLASAAEALNRRGVSAPVVMELTDANYSTSAVSIAKITGTSATNTITIRPASGNKAVITGTSATGLINLVGTENIIIDGSNNGTTSRDLFIQNTALGKVTLQLQGTTENKGVHNCILKNIIIKGGNSSASMGVLVGGEAYPYGDAHQNILIQNNIIYNCANAVSIIGNSLNGKITKVTLWDNIIGTDSSAFNNTLYGVYLTYADSVIVKHNTIKNLKQTSTGISVGIRIYEYTTNSIITANTIKDVHTLYSYNFEAVGIYVASASGINNITISNNAISGIIARNTVAASGASGIKVLSGSNIKLYYNTVNLYIPFGMSVDINSSAALYTTVTSGMDIRNNIFSNSITGAGFGVRQYSVLCIPPAQASVFDYNDFIVNGPQGILMRGYNGSTYVDCATLTQLKTITNANAHSVSINPIFASDSNLVPNPDLIDGLGMTIGETAVDILDSVRSNPPTLGAYEKGIDGLSPQITYTPLTNTVQSTNRTITDFATITDYSGINTTTARPRLYFKKAGDTSLFGNYPADNHAAFNGWKYVETSGSTSPFSFTIDYSLLTNGGIALWDTVQYFVAATDNLDTLHVSAYPSNGFAASSINNIISAPETVNNYIIVDNPLSGNYLVGFSQVYPNFSSLTSAVRSLNLSGINAPVTFLLTDSLYSQATEVFPVTINEIPGSSVLNTVTIKPAPGKKVSIIGGSGTGVITFNGADNIILDGSNNGTLSQDLFIYNNKASVGAVVMFQGTNDSIGSRNCVLKNTILKGAHPNAFVQAYGLVIGGQAPSLASGGRHYNISVQNNAIYNCASAVVLRGGSTKSSNITLSGNTFGSDTIQMGIGENGIYVSSVDSVTISSNTIKNVRGNSSVLNIGLLIAGNTTNSIVSKNTIKAIQGYPSYAGNNDNYITCGIKLTGSNNSNIEFRNNVIADVSNQEYWSELGLQVRVAGIKLETGTNIRLFFNSVHLSGQLVRGACASLYLDPASTSGLDIRNNIFSNTLTRDYYEPGVSFALCMSAPSPAPNGIFDYNNFTTGGNNGVLMGIRDGASLIGISTLAGLKTATNANANAVNIDPHFASGTNLVIGKNTLSGSGIAIPGITTDILDTVRSNPPSIGAYEKEADISGPEISYYPLNNTKTLSNRVISSFATISDYSGVNTTSAKPRIYYRKSTEANVFGAYPTNNNALFNGWKYAEASNATSPFDFTIDYSRLTSGGVSELDTILYFVVAQDTSENTNIASNPGSGFFAVRLDSIISAPDVPNSYMIEYIPLAGNYFVGATQTAPNYTTITAAVNALNLRGISAPVVFQLTSATYTTPAETFPITINEISGVDTNITVTFKPVAGNNVSIVGNIAGNALINFNGTDRFIFDGSNNGTSSQNLFMRNMNASGMGVWFQGDIYNQGAQNTVFKNIKIRGTSNSSSYGIIIGGTASAYSWGGSMLGGIGKGGVGHDNLLIENNVIYNCVDALVISGESDINKVHGVRIIGNTIGSDTVNLPNTKNGIYLQFNDGVTIQKNTIKNTKTTSSIFNAAGINVKDNTYGCIISNNIIRGIYATSLSGSGAYGINMDAPGINNILIYNNAVSDIITSNYSSSPVTAKNAYGIRVAGVTDLYMYFNTVHLYGQPAIGNSLSSSAALLIENASATDIRNNIFSNNMTGKVAGSQHYALSILNTPYGYAFDYNNFIANSAQGVLMYDSISATGINTLSGLRAATFANAHSVSIDPQFVSNTNLAIGNNTLQGLGTDTFSFWSYPAVSFAKDILDSNRRTPPSIGAYEGSLGTAPVKLILFNAQTNADDVALNWTTASEINNKGFDIERSADGRNFERINFVKGKGNNTQTMHYAITDENAFALNGVLYYRLKQIDFDGQYTYSSIVKVNKAMSNVNSITAFPNPYSSTYTLSFTTKTGESISIDMMDMQGGVVVTRTAEVKAGINLIEIPEANLIQPGVYIVRLTIDKEVHIVKVVKN